MTVVLKDKTSRRGRTADEMTQLHFKKIYHSCTVRNTFSYRIGPTQIHTSIRQKKWYISASAIGRTKRQPRNNISGLKAYNIFAFILSREPVLLFFHHRHLFSAFDNSESAITALACIPFYLALSFSSFSCPHCRIVGFLPRFILFQPIPFFLHLLCGI